MSKLPGRELEAEDVPDFEQILCGPRTILRGEPECLPHRFPDQAGNRPGCDGAIGLREDRIDHPIHGVCCARAVFGCFGSGVATGRKTMSLEFGFLPQTFQSRPFLGRELGNLV